MIFDALLNNAPKSVRARNPKVSAELERIIGQLLEKDRALRYASAAALRDDLERLQSGLSPAAARGRRNPLLTYGIGAAANDDVVEMATHSAGEDPARAGNRYFIAAAAVNRNSQTRVRGDLLRCDRLVG